MRPRSPTPSNAAEDRAHKHTDNPTEETVRQQTYDAVMIELTETFYFGDSYMHEA